MDTRTFLALALVLAVKVGAGAAQEWCEPNSGASFDLEAHPHPYTTVFSTMHQWIDKNRDMEPLDLEGFDDHPKLPVQQLSMKPAHWLNPLLIGRDEKATNLAFRIDNLYLSAFTNGKGVWFRFKLDKKGHYVVPGARALGFRGNYASLVGRETGEQAWQRLQHLVITREATLDAIAVLSDYDPSTTPDEAIKLALARIIVVFMEAQRFPFIRQRVHDIWEGLDLHGGELGARGAQLVGNWNRISCALRNWDTKDDKSKWEGKEADKLKQEPPAGLSITTPEQALAEIWPIHIGDCDE